MAPVYHYPKSLPRSLQPHWRRPWGLRARHSRKFHTWLGRHGYLSPHFRKEEAACKDGTFVPYSLIHNARKHAFNLERLRHALNDNPVRIISWYRTPSYNYAVGGASQSKHVEALATDHPVEWVKKHPNFEKYAEKYFANGGIGAYPGGNRHLDSRGYRARWSAFTPANQK